MMPAPLIPHQMYICCSGPWSSSLVLSIFTRLQIGLLLQNWHLSPYKYTHKTHTHTHTNLFVCKGGGDRKKGKCQTSSCMCLVSVLCILQILVMGRCLISPLARSAAVALMTRACSLETSGRPEQQPLGHRFPTDQCCDVWCLEKGHHFLKQKTQREMVEEQWGVS